MVSNLHETRSLSLVGSLRQAKVITPSDTDDLEFETRAIYVSKPGDLSVVMADGQMITLTNLLAGVLYPLAVHRINTTGTTIDGVLALA